MGSPECYSEEEMTKVQHTYRLARPLLEHDFEGIRKAHSVFGMLRVQALSADTLLVEWDASRLMQRDAERVLAENGVPIVKEA
jgi:hypothetical protein